MNRLCILGSTGSIGRNTLKIAEGFPDRFSVRALGAKGQVALLAEQIRIFRPEIAVVYDDRRAGELKGMLRPEDRVEILVGPEGYAAAASCDVIDTVMVAVVGAAGLLPTLSAIEAGKTVALANKETLVMAGHLVMEKVARSAGRLLPVDSEHSAIFQCLAGQRREDLERIHLTASGGPFLNRPRKEFSRITPEEALRHPNWRMGRKISVDSATLMNKGLEVIEARHLFQVPLDRIEVLIHPQSVVHSMVSFQDGSVIAQLGVPDMKGAIAYALSYPERLPLKQLPDFKRLAPLTFAEPDLEKFPCLGLALSACRAGGTLPAVLNAANEIAVEAFLEKKLPFTEIARVVLKTLEEHRTVSHPILEDILEADRWAREKAKEFLS